MISLDNRPGPIIVNNQGEELEEFLKKWIWNFKRAGASNEYIKKEIRLFLLEFGLEDPIKE